MRVLLTGSLAAIRHTDLCRVDASLEHATEIGEHLPAEIRRYLTESAIDGLQPFDVYELPLRYCHGLLLSPLESIGESLPLLRLPSLVHPVHHRPEDFRRSRQKVDRADAGVLCESRNDVYDAVASSPFPSASTGLSPSSVSIQLSKSSAVSPSRLRTAHAR